MTLDVARFISALERRGAIFTWHDDTNFEYWLLDLGPVEDLEPGEYETLGWTAMDHYDAIREHLLSREVRH